MMSNLKPKAAELLSALCLALLVACACSESGSGDENPDDESDGTVGDDESPSDGGGGTVSDGETPSTTTPTSGSEDDPTPPSSRGGASGVSSGGMAGNSVAGGAASGGNGNGDSGVGGSGGDGNGDSGSGGSGGEPEQPATSGVCGANEGQLFDGSYPWNQAIDDAALDSESEVMIAYLQANHTDGSRFRVDGPSEEPDSLYGITVLSAGDETQHQSFSETSDFYSPDCDSVPVPLPEGGAIEANSAYACEDDGDCHLIVIDTDECRLFEMWRANRDDNDFEGGCLAVWDLEQPYTETLRGDCCTSADAAGLPIAAHMWSADEIAAGAIRHAVRFILPNRLMRERIYVRPATHSTSATSGPDDAPPYGARLRLRADFDMSGLNPAAQVVAQALQTYGMILSDGGNLTFTAVNDRFTENKWVDVGFGPNDLTSLEWADFEVVDGGERFVWDGACSCERASLSE